MLLRLMLYALVLLVAASAPAYAQSSSDKPVQWHLQGGVNSPTGSASDLLNTGWAFGIGAIYRPPQSPFGVRFDVNYWNNNVSAGGTYQAAGATRLDITGGRVDGWSAVLDGEFHHSFTDTVYGYGLAGIGAYYVNAELTETGVGYVCNPWWYYCYYGTGDVIVASHSSTKFGWNVGLGVGFVLSGGSSLYLEARYTEIDTANESLKYIPIVIGVRF